MGSAIETLVNREYPYGFVTDVETDTIGLGLNEDVIRVISQKKNEPDFMLAWRLKGYRRWLTMKEPHWANIHYDPIDYQAISYYSAPKSVKPLQSLDDVDPELLSAYKKLGISLNEQKMLAGVAVDAIFDSVSVGTTMKEELAKHGIVFCSFGEALQTHPEIVEKYLGTVVPHSDNFFAALNAAVFSDGSFCYVPKGVKCPMELRSVISRDARRRNATPISCTRQWSSSSRSTTRRSSTRRSRTGTQATPTGRVESSTSSRSAGSASA